MATTTSAGESVLEGLHDVLDDVESLYEDVHSHPELSMQEKRTAGIAADRLKSAGFEVTDGVGKTGVVGLLHNGDEFAPVLHPTLETGVEALVTGACAWLSA